MQSVRSRLLHVKYGHIYQNESEENGHLLMEASAFEVLFLIFYNLRRAKPRKTNHYHTPYIIPISKFGASKAYQNATLI